MNVETVEMPGNNGGSIYFTTAADPANGTVYVVCKNVPSIIKLAPPGAGRGGRGNADAAGGPMAAADRECGACDAGAAGRATYEQNCQSCHGADLSGTNAPKLSDVVARLGGPTTREIVGGGRGDMPASARCRRRP